MLFDAMQDLRYAIRTLTKAPAFALTAILTLAVGIGATVGTFTIVNAVLLRPLPIAQPNELAIVGAESVTSKATVSASWTKYQMVRDTNRVFSDIAASTGRDLAFSDGKAPEQVNGSRVTWNYFNVLGVTPEAGRVFRADEDVENAAPVAIVTDSFVQRKFGGNPAALVGRSVTIEGRATTIVGVLPAGFRIQFKDHEPQVFLTQVFTPGVMTAAQVQHGAGFLEYVGRLKPGMTVADAASDLATIDRRYREQFGSNVDASRFVLHVTAFNENLLGDVRPGLLVLMGAVALVLLIACANVAHLLLARAASRQHEIGVRLALGASRSRLIRQFLTESLLLSAAGCIVGWWAVSIVMELLVARAPANIPRLGDTRPDATVLLFAVGVSFATAVIFGIMPALRATRVRVGEVLKETRAGGLTSRATGRLHHLLATSETAVTVALLIAAGLLFQSLMKMQQVDVGFTSTNVYAAHEALPRAKYPLPADRERFFTQLLDSVRQQPGLANAGAISYLPMGGDNYGFFFYREEARDKDNVISVRHVGGDYFRAMQIPVRRGRVFTDRDDARSLPVAIINESTAKHYFADTDPVGRRIASTTDNVLREIVGVVSDVRFDGPAKSGQDELYVPYKQIPWPAMSIVVNSSLGADQVIGALRREVAKLDLDQAVADIRPMPAIVASSMTQQEFTSGLLGVFALLATTLAIVGLYGVTTLFVTERRHEFGIRMALGARPDDVMRLVMTEGACMVGVGAIVGVAGAFAARRVLAGLLFGVTASDAKTYVIGTAIVCAVGLLACFVPARRLLRLDPMRALRL
ncbi:MAG TPA: ABC transporter permease [Vicinamibacterales bacterium]|nr:ABC transporter permease [Vicinamibacterales bacterium]